MSPINDDRRSKCHALVRTRIRDRLSVAIVTPAPFNHVAFTALASCSNPAVTALTRFRQLVAFIAGARARNPTRHRVALSDALFWRSKRLRSAFATFFFFDALFLDSLPTPETRDFPSASSRVRRANSPTTKSRANWELILGVRFARAGALLVARRVDRRSILCRDEPFFRDILTSYGQTLTSNARSHHSNIKAESDSLRMHLRLVLVLKCCIKER